MKKLLTGLLVLLIFTSACKAEIHMVGKWQFQFNDMLIEIDYTRRAKCLREQSEDELDYTLEYTTTVHYDNGEHIDAFAQEKYKNYTRIHYYDETPPELIRDGKHSLQWERWLSEHDITVLIGVVTKRFGNYYIYINEIDEYIEMEQIL